jgi:formylglycine-generating enzyme required for sulfatase activity
VQETTLGLKDMTNSLRQGLRFAWITCLVLATGHVAKAAKRGDSQINLKDGAVMLYVPPGAFTMGFARSDKTADADNKPSHRVRITRGFWMYKTEVTNAQYGKFLEDTHHEEPEYWSDARFNKPQQPVVGIVWDDAVAYCRWAGGRLPTEAEWEYAAAGTDRRSFPWGNSRPNASRAVFNPYIREKEMHFITTSGAPQAVGTRPKGASPFGLLDMAGNVSEWCSDWFSPYPRGSVTDPRGGARNSWSDSAAWGMRVDRGGSWADDPGGGGPFLHHSLLEVKSRGEMSPDWNHNDTVGFRCLIPEQPQSNTHSTRHAMPSVGR